ncbi:PREDICTED: beta-glucosidase 12-like [Ipomoea nil]|uniref:beta-glucosidase 12-like n=1 Tax=Ipomoea nil TaxID=35883 RepID=UPI000901F647|nr:PREDICTED: beta-glucosidase 12-like [Ipomoea nil]
MAAKDSFIVNLLMMIVIVLGNLLGWHEMKVVGDATLPFNRTSFPPHFIFGTASSAYQYEGAARVGGRGLSIWDTYTHKHSERILDHNNGDVAVDFYHRYKEDIKLMKDEGLDGFRFSISWSRILPYGKLSKGINKEGIAFYNNLINELLVKGIKPIVTLFHWDLPQALEEEYLGFLSPKIVEDFKDYAEICFKEFGDRVKVWATLNEPWSFASVGYDSGKFAPGRCSSWMDNINGCPTPGNSATEPYIVAHHLLLAHAAAAQLYTQKYKKGDIGIVLVSNWFVPYSKTASDAEAAQRALDFMFGWFMHPLARGEYPKSMRTIVGNRLPEFTSEEAKMVKGSFDFLGLNYYTANYAANIPSPSMVNLSYSTDSRANLTNERNGKLIGARTGIGLSIVPKGLTELILYVKKNYNNPVIYITENGMSDANITEVQQGVNDTLRVHFYHSHLLAIKAALMDGANVKGFFAWSFLDNFEWTFGYTQRFGINYINYKDNLKRYPKHSALWFKKFLLK